MMLRYVNLGRLVAVGAALACAVIGVQSISPTPASALLTFPFDGQITPPSGSFGRSELDAADLAFLEPGGVAIDDFNGETYVAEEISLQANAQGQDAVVVFAGGAELPALDAALTPAGSFGNGAIAVAASNSTGEVYVLDSADNAVDVFDSTGNYLCQITGAGSNSTSPSECDTSTSSTENPATPAGGFHEPRGITVDQATGEVYVVDSQHGVIDIFSGTGAYERQIELSQAGGEPSRMHDVAVSGFNGHVYVAEEAGVVQEFDATGAYLTAWTGENTPGGRFEGEVISVAADDHNGDVYVTASRRQATYAFDSTGAYLAQLSHNYHFPANTAVDQATGKVYVSDRGAAQVVDVLGPGIIVPDVVTEPATEIQAHGAVLNGVVDPDETQLTDCRFEYGTNTTYGQSAPCVPAAGSIPGDGAQHQIAAEIEGLKAGTTYHFRLAAANAAGENPGGDETLSTPPGPAITGETAQNLTSETAELTAEINPEGAATTYHFEYDTRPYLAGEAPHGKTPSGGEGAIPVGSEPERVSATLTELHATTSTYYWRVIATNSRETTTGGEHSFIYASSSSGLPDGRAYEMVTPPEKNGALIGRGIFLLRSVVSGNGTRVMAASIQCFAEALSCVAQRQSEGEAYSFTRTSAGWQATALAPPPLAENGNSLLGLEADTGVALFSMPTPPVGEDDFYARKADGSLLHIGPSTPRASGVSFSTPLATPDLSHVVYEMQGSSEWPFDPTVLEVGSKSSMELSGENDPVPSLIGVSPGGTELVSACSTVIGAGGGFHALSLDGATVYFTAEGHDQSECPASAHAPATSELYARVDESRTVPISQRSQLDCTTGACQSSPPSDAYFQDASVDGKQAFFTDTQQLTNDATEDGDPADTAALGQCRATEGPNGCNLYEYDFDNPAGHNLVAVSAGDTSGLGPQVQRVMATSDDGSHLYFVAKGVLSDASNDQGSHAVAGGENLYVYERDAAHPDGHVAFIATLSSADAGESVNTGPGTAVHEPNVTPDGRFLVFASHADLTLDDDSTSGAAQVFRYDAQTEQLIRISIGEQGFNDNGNTFETLCTNLECAQDALIAENTENYRRDQTMSDDGAFVFFTSPVALTAHALNDVKIGVRNGLPVFAKNVYEYHEGHVYLISDGKDVERIGEVTSVASAVELLGSDRTGANVFFSTADQLVPQDTDTERDYYDARICTAASPCIPPTAPPLPPCLGEVCHGTPVPGPARFAPASASFSGEGNIPPSAPPKARKVTTGLRAKQLAKALKVCQAKHSHRKRRTCEGQARRRYGSAVGRKQTRSMSRKGGK